MQQTLLRLGTQIENRLPTGLLGLFGALIFCAVVLDSSSIRAAPQQQRSGFLVGFEAAPFLPLPEPGPPSAQVKEGLGESREKTVQKDQTTAQPQQPEVAESKAVKKDAGLPSQQSSFGVWEIIKAGGTVGFIIIGLSLVAGALVVEQLITLRKSVLMPPEVVSQLGQAMAARDSKGLMATCEAHPCVFTDVLKAGLAEWEGGWHQVEKALEDALTEYTAKLLRKVEYLSVIGNLAPMLGLLGTVVGMILAFKTVAETQGAARAADLAQAIYLALVTTVEGLIVAIPSLAAYAYFRNRVDELMAEVAVTLQQLLAPLRRRRVAAKPPVSSSGAPPSGSVRG
ncbi:MotA/TolQ/ExbB proton channel family protein [Thermogutta terrifontis]|uniref:MotA/TolQ/ExbB proton channel family protein n=1 Tax=Thermogutta terrifontis TaxID=1331910 RepID=A0A286RF77_9BACT|nr:MotA/TolQ/ExbB proton channel family protein [Thermogutta terrifontis]ASV74614.1 MotA/TolQ/ExbB proton channel family protein [Thermogutta terrifontis]